MNHHGVGTNPRGAVSGNNRHKLVACLACVLSSHHISYVCITYKNDSHNTTPTMLKINNKYPPGACIHPAQAKST